MNIATYDVHYILINNRSLADILFYDAFIKIGLSNDILEKLNSPLVGFFGSTIPIEGVIQLSLIVGRAPRQRTSRSNSWP